MHSLSARILYSVFETLAISPPFDNLQMAYDTQTDFSVFCKVIFLHERPSWQTSVLVHSTPSAKPLMTLACGDAMHLSRSGAYFFSPILNSDLVPVVQVLSSTQTDNFCYLPFSAVRSLTGRHPLFCMQSVDFRQCPPTSTEYGTTFFAMHLSVLKVMSYLSFNLSL
jgi:hypothetical protein